MDPNQPASGKGSPCDSRSEYQVSPSLISPTFTNATTAHFPQSQNSNTATGYGGSSTIVNISMNSQKHSDLGQTTSLQQDDFDTARADHEIYSSRLLTKKRGYPLWVPGPGMQLPIEYRRQGVSIGDVGVITSTGEFDFLFNIFLAASHPINRGSVPEKFIPLPCQDLDIQKTVVYGPNTHLACTSVRKIATHLTDETSTNHRFESTAKEAAILVMPHGATSLDLLNTWGIRFTISKKARDWYTYAQITRGRHVNDGDIRVVVGVDKVSSWGIATSSCKSGQTASCVFKLDQNHTYEWDCTGASGRVGPQKGEIRDLKEDNVDPENQCLFVRTLGFNLSGDTWYDFSPDALQQTGAGSGNYFGYRDSGSPRSRHTRSGSDSSSSSHQPLSMQGFLLSVNPDPVEPAGAAYPSPKLQDCLNEKTCIITRDADSIPVLSNEDVEDSSGRILEARGPQNGIAEHTRVRDAGTPLVGSESHADSSPRADGNQDTKPTSPVNVSGSHEPEPLRLDLSPPQDGLKTPDEHSATEHTIDHESVPLNDFCGTNPDKQRPSSQETDTVESGLNRDPSVEQVTMGNPQRTIERDAQSCSANTTLLELPEKTSPSEPCELGDNERLAELGTSVLNYAVTVHLVSKRPVLSAEEIRTWRAHYTSSNMLDNWLNLCQPKQNFHVHDHEQMAARFRSYVGTLYITKGLPTLQTWITELIDSGIEPLANQSNGNSSGHTSTSTSEPSHSGPSISSVSLVHELASKRRVSVEYRLSAKGPSHQPIWTVRCLIDDVEKGVGVGGNKRSAKELAARQARVAMGW